MEQQHDRYSLLDTFSKLKLSLSFKTINEFLLEIYIYFENEVNKWGKITFLNVLSRSPGFQFEFNKHLHS